MSKKTFDVVIPIAGHCFVQVEADNEEDAIGKAFEKVSLDDVQEWEALTRFHSGNVCHCPSPWEVEVEEVEDDE